MKSSQLFHIIKNKSTVEICDLLRISKVEDEKLFNEVVINRLMRDYEIVSFVLANKLSFTEKQLYWISQTKYIQNLKEDREKFENLYGYDVKRKRFSINKLSKYTQRKGLRVASGDINRTIKIGADIKPLDVSQKAWLKNYLEEWDRLETLLLEDLYSLFRLDPGLLLSKAADVSHTRKYREEKFEFSEGVVKDDFGNDIIFPIAKEGEESYLIYKLEYKNKESDKSYKKEYIASNCTGLDIKIELNSESGGFEFKKFSGQSLYNDPVAPKYFSLKPVKEKYQTSFYTEGIKIPKEAEYLDGSQIKETLGKGVADTVCSFLDKYYGAISEVGITYRSNNKIFEKNKKNISLLKKEAQENTLFLENMAYPSQIESPTNELVEAYNSFVTTYNQLLNEEIWQQDILNNAKLKPKKEFKKLTRIKGIPSFPKVERNQVRNPEKVLKAVIEDYNLVKTLFDDSIQSYDFQGPTLNNFLSRKSGQSGKLMQEAFKDIAQKYDYSEDQWGRMIFKSENSKDIYLSLVSFLDVKIDEVDLSKTLESELSIREVRDVVDLYAQYISLLAHISFDKSSPEYYDFRIRVNTNLSLLKARPFEDENYTKEQLNFSGYSVTNSKFNKGLALAFKEVEDKLQFYIIFNLHQNIHLKFVEQETEFKAIAYEKGVPVISNLNFDQGKRGTLIIPLQFGKRIGRKYFYQSLERSNAGINELEYLKSGMIQFQNARFIREEKFGVEKYYFATSLKKSLTSSDAQKNYDYSRVMGMDMGEKIPAVIVSVDKKTQEILKAKALHPETNDKLWNIQKQKDKAQEELGIIPEKLRDKIKNLTQKLLEDIAIESLEKAITANSMLVTEDLSRGFGRGSQKGTYVWMRQYTKLNDILFSKANELGMSSRQPMTNSSNGILGKVVAANTSKVSLQTGFLLRSPGYLIIQDESISDLSEIIISDDLGTEFVLNLDQKTVFVTWRDWRKEIEFIGKRSELGRFFNETNRGNSLFDYIIEEVFDNRTSNSQKRRKLVVSFVYNLLNPRKTQEEYKDIFTGDSVNADLQGAANVARSFGWIQSKVYIKSVKGKSLSSSEKMMMYQDWYIKNCIENKTLPDFVFNDSWKRSQ